MSERGINMTTKRQMRVSKNRIPSRLTASYLGGLAAEAFLEDGNLRPGVPSKLTTEEHHLVAEYEHCHMDFEKWLKYRERKFKLKSRKAGK